MAICMCAVISELDKSAPEDSETANYLMKLELWCHALRLIRARPRYSGLYVYNLVEIH